ncbi:MULTISPECIES: TetR/AcrR family transcriptional regulator [Prauserella salsuginis group]|uniref:AcrR family transcriptional regulator n=2 Tax=Prauserella salsuginis group TaxID=2893672 RepID=A0A839XJA9_9PSEU|nr:MULTISPECIES: TetR/AcrR family transcriptional regulator [Prauserella salsuginis group]MBB3664022.1 AcrR family transcriptional regulator [Prauserella sediminis]MCR3721477.1 transcriptional regulator, TetR family [Prauserella flava]MCR3732467.1 transcriptional regulator, TetR family [Prauserella salsuginis]
MGRPSAREQVLDAYEDLLIEKGLAAVTLDAVAARADVSKGGLLYHFKSKEALLDGLIDRLLDRTRRDMEHARNAPEGMVRYLLSTSVTDADMAKPAHRTSVAALRLLGSEPKADEALATSFRMWTDLAHEYVDDPLTAELIGLIGDGLYLRATLMGRDMRTPVLDELPEVFRRLGITDSRVTGGQEGDTGDEDSAGR